MEVFQGHPVHVGHGVALAHDDGEVVVEEYVRLYVVVGLRRLEGQHEVHLLLPQHVHEFLHRLVADVELHLGVLAHEVEQGLCQYGAEGVGDPYVERAHEQFLQVSDAVHAGLRGVERMEGAREHFPPGLGERDLVVVPLEELRVELLFQLLYLLREGALRNEELTGRVGKVERLRQLGEILELSQFHGVFVMMLSGCLKGDVLEEEDGYGGAYYHAEYDEAAGHAVGAEQVEVVGEGGFFLVV